MSLHLQTQSAQSSCTNTSCCPPKQAIRNTAKKIGRNDPCPAVVVRSLKVL